MRMHVSASLDGELSEVERAALDAHLASCARCRAYAAGAAETARLLRAAPLEALDFPVALPSRRLAVARRLQVAAAAAALAVTVGLGALVGSVGSGEPSRPGTSPRLASTHVTSLRFPEQELKMLRRSTSLRHHHHARFAL
jgi:anti-sigma factor RsiW